MFKNILFKLICNLIIGFLPIFVFSQEARRIDSEITRHILIRMYGCIDSVFKITPSIYGGRRGFRVVDTSSTFDSSFGRSYFQNNTPYMILKSCPYDWNMNLDEDIDIGIDKIAYSETGEIQIRIIFFMGSNVGGKSPFMMNMSYEWKPKLKLLQVKKEEIEQIDNWDFTSSNLR